MLLTDPNLLLSLRAETENCFCVRFINDDIIAVLAGGKPDFETLLTRGEMPPEFRAAGRDRTRLAECTGLAATAVAHPPAARRRLVRRMCLARPVPSGVEFSQTHWRAASAE